MFTKPSRTNSAQQYNFVPQRSFWDGARNWLYYIFLAAVIAIVKFSCSGSGGSSSSSVGGYRDYYTGTVCSTGAGYTDNSVSEPFSARNYDSIIARLQRMPSITNTRLPEFKKFLMDGDQSLVERLKAIKDSTRAFKALYHNIPRRSVLSTMELLETDAMGVDAVTEAKNLDGFAPTPTVIDDSETTDVRLDSTPCVTEEDSTPN